MAPPTGTVPGLDGSYYNKLFTIRAQRPILDVDDLEKTLRQLVVKHGIRISGPFRDYDRLNRGQVTVSQFKSALGAVKFPKFQLSDEMLSLLADKYKLVSSEGIEWFQYRPFLALMEGIFDPESEGAGETFTTGGSNPSEADKQVGVVLDKIRLIVSTRRLLLKPVFKDFDRVTKGIYQTEHVTKERFARALTTLSIHLTPAELQLLCTKYDDRGNGEVNYVSFCRDVEPIDNV